MANLVEARMTVMLSSCFHSGQVVMGSQHRPQHRLKEEEVGGGGGRDGSGGGRP